MSARPCSALRGESCRVREEIGLEIGLEIELKIWLEIVLVIVLKIGLAKGLRIMLEMGLEREELSGKELRDREPISITLLKGLLLIQLLLLLLSVLRVGVRVRVSTPISPDLRLLTLLNLALSLTL
jgi:hypothetical protein